MSKHYLCGVDYQHELGETDEIGIYDSIEELKSKAKCWKECGIVEIETDGKPEDYTSHKWIEKQDMKWGKE